MNLGRCGKIRKMISENEAKQGPWFGGMGGEGPNKGLFTNILKSAGWWRALGMGRPAGTLVLKFMMNRRK